MSASRYAEFVTRKTCCGGTALSIPVTKHHVGGWSLMFGDRLYWPNCDGRGSSCSCSESAIGRASIGRGRLVSHGTSFIADQRGAVAFEMLIVFLFLGLSLLLPLADIAVAGIQYISAWEALRAFGQSIQYAPPSDVTNASAWATSALAKADPRFSIPSIQLVCGDGN